MNPPVFPCTSPVSPPPSLHLHLHLARTAAIKALTDKINNRPDNLAGTSTGEVSTSERTSGPAGGTYTGDSDSETDLNEEIAQWGARRQLLGGDRTGQSTLPGRRRRGQHRLNMFTSLNPHPNKCTVMPVPLMLPCPTLSTAMLGNSPTTVRWCANGELALLRDVMQHTGAIVLLRDIEGFTGQKSWHGAIARHRGNRPCDGTTPSTPGRRHCYGTLRGYG